MRRHTDDFAEQIAKWEEKMQLHLTLAAKREEKVEFFTNAIREAERRLLSLRENVRVAARLRDTELGYLQSAREKVKRLKRLAGTAVV